MTKPPRALTIAGSDSGGGAGIQADLKTFFAHGVHGMSAICALTAQNTTGVTAVEVMSPEFVAEQIEQVVSDIGVDAVKTGMLANEGIVRTVVDSIKRHGLDKVVVDPVFVSKNKDRLLDEGAVDALVGGLFPLAEIITPNRDEAAALLSREIDTPEDMKDAALALHDFGPAYVLVKGGDFESDFATDVLYDGTDLIEYTHPRIDSKNTHGTGCTLASAIAAHLALGASTPEAVGKAKDFVTGAIKAGLDIGKGFGPVNQGWDSSMP
jgi:hydroxymethylpyrimidine/phosphomethylpyrimidine kinase